jgi:hypothetical protein
MRQVLRAAIPLGSGILTGCVIHYMLYRIGLPLQPFIYVAF